MVAIQTCQNGVTPEPILAYSCRITKFCMVIHHKIYATFISVILFVENRRTKLQQNPYLAFTLMAITNEHFR
jgi:hypothetical protein